MLIFIFLVSILSIVIDIIDTNNKEKVMGDFCRVECMGYRNTYDTGKLEVR